MALAAAMPTLSKYTEDTATGLLRIICYVVLLHICKNSGLSLHGYFFFSPFLWFKEAVFASGIAVLALVLPPFLSVQRCVKLMYAVD